MDLCHFELEGAIACIEVLFILFIYLFISPHTDGDTEFTYKFEIKSLIGIGVLIGTGVLIGI